MSDPAATEKDDDDVAKVDVKQDVAASVEETVQHVVQEVCGPVNEDQQQQQQQQPKVTPKKRRLCRYPGCSKVIKSQGHCQRHGARAKRCKVEGCEKQAQGTHDGMCKRHWKQVHFPPPAVKPEDQPPPPEGESVYDKILPSSISYRPTANKNKMKAEDETNLADGVTVMPLITFLREGASKEAGWHRNAERRARGHFPVTSPSSQLEPWERQLALVEILLLSGGTPYANFKDLAHAWGREKGFHNLLVNSICERRGEVDRKRRSDARTPEERKAASERRKKAKIEAAVASAAAPAELKASSVDELVVNGSEAPVEVVGDPVDTSIVTEAMKEENATVSV